MDTGALIYFLCLEFMLVIFLIGAKAQQLPDGVDNPVETSTTLNKSMTEAVNGNRAVENGTFEFTSSLSYYPTDHSSSSSSADEQVGRKTSMWRWQPINWSWWLILQMITAVLGIVGNSLVITVLLQRRRKCRSTDTLVGALATADLFTSIFIIPLPLADRVPLTILGEIYCRVIYTSVLMWVAIFASIMTLTFIPVQQYIAVVYPFRSKEILSRKRISLVLVLIWLVSFLLPWLHAVYSFHPKVDEIQQKCSSSFPSRELQISLGVVLFIFKFLIPTLLTLTLQGLTAHSLHRQSQVHLGVDKRLDQSNPSTRHLIAKKRVLQMLFIVVLLFIICWGPNQLIFLAFNLRLIPGTYLYSPMNHAFTVLGFCNSCANPIIYAVRYPEFRKAMKDLFTLAKRTDAPLFDDGASKPSDSPPRNAKVV